jgi:hypothetical protein
MTEPHAEPAGHPSPHRARTRIASLLYGLMAAPMAWVVSQVVNSTLAQEACFPGAQPLAAPAFGGLHAMQAVVLLAALLVSASAMWVALGTWRSTRHEQSGDRHALLSIGEGRSRFMAFAGVLTSLGFLVASLFSAPALILVAGC